MKSTSSVPTNDPPERNRRSGMLNPRVAQTWCPEAGSNDEDTFVIPQGFPPRKRLQPHSTNNPPRSCPCKTHHDLILLIVNQVGYLLSFFTLDGDASPSETTTPAEPDISSKMFVHQSRKSLMGPYHQPRSISNMSPHSQPHQLPHSVQNTKRDDGDKEGTAPFLVR